MSGTVPDPVSSRAAPYRPLVLALGLCAVVAASSLIIFHRLSEASMFGDESIYALTSREAVERNTWLPLYKATGQLFPNKPPAKILLVTACFRWFGESEFSARLPDALFGVLTIAGVYIFSARRFGVGTGLLAAAILLGAEGYLCVHGVRDSVMDTMLTLLAFAMCVAWVNFREASSRSLGWWAAAACAVLLANVTKNMLGVAFAVVVVAIEAALSVFARKRLRTLMPALALLATALAGGAAYFAAMMFVTDGAFAAYLREDIVVRASTGVDPAHLEGPFFYLQTLGVEFRWWLVLLLPAIWGARLARLGGAPSAIGFCALWSVGIVGGFSFAVSKLPWYIYPAYPTLAVVMAFGAREIVRKLPNGTLRAAAATVIAGAVAVEVRASWHAVQRDTMVIDEHRFVRAYSKLESAALVIDERSITRHGRVRARSRFYLEGAPNSTWLERGRLSFPEADIECLYLATGEPHAFPPTEALPWRTVARLRNPDSLAGVIWIIGTCDLELPWAQGREVELHRGLIRADDFETGDLRGWASSQEP